MKKLLLFLLLPILCYGQVQIGDDIDGEAAGDESGWGISMSFDGSTVAIGAPKNDGNGSTSGHVRIYEYQTGSWIQKGDDIDGEDSSDNSGRAVSLSSDGNIIAIGSPGLSSNASGQVRVFEFQGGNWTQLGQGINGEGVLDNSGRAVSLSNDGTIIAIGSPENNDNGASSGQVRIYEFQGGSWIQLGQDIEGESFGDRSGFSIDLSSNGGIIAIGAFGNNNNNGGDAGHVRVYEFQGGNWTQLGQDIDGEAQDDLSGISVNLSSDGSIVAIGGLYNDNINGEFSGHVRVYEFQSQDWTQLGEDIDGENVNSQSGASISLSSDGSVLAIGAPGNSDNALNSGHARIYEYQGGNWTQVGQDIDGEAISDRFGSMVSLSGNKSSVAIGAPFNDGNSSDIGHVKVFDLSNILSTQVFISTTFSIYPNPAKDNFTITLLESDVLQKATIYNSLGQEVLQSTQTNIDVSSLSKGVYVVEVQTSTGKGSEKLIIN